ncbi:MAG TPA: ABC transporter ATP-binding protein [Polyangiales bacterium]|nr:ABC transporter ATP-binding protein [Polyangiales bacterium]
MTDDTLALPSYKEQAPEVSARFAEIKQRPVVLEIDHLGKVFDSNKGKITALNDVSFNVHRKEFVSVIGPSGCGKSTLIRILAGLDRPSSGAVKLDGEKVEGPCKDRGMVFQGYTLFPWLCVRDNVTFGPRMAGMPTAKANEKAAEWLDVIGLRRFADHYPDQLSGGMKQRVAIARALANEPRILLMDEPFGALDAQTRAGMQAHLIKVWDSVDLTILFITHDLDEAVYLSDRIVVLAAHPGRIHEVIEVPVPRPRDRAQFLSPAFLATKNRLEELIYGSAGGEQTSEMELRHAGQ